MPAGVLDLGRMAELVPGQDGFQVRQTLAPTDQLSVQDGAWRQRRQYLHFGIAAAVVRQLPAPQVPAAGGLELLGPARQGPDAVPFHLKEILRRIERLSTHRQHRPEALVHADLRPGDFRDDFFFWLGLTSMSAVGLPSAEWPCLRSPGCCRAWATLRLRASTKGKMATSSGTGAARLRPSSLA